MFKKWHKITLLIFLFVSVLYLLVSTIKTTYWMIVNPQNRAVPYVYQLPLQVVTLGVFPSLALLLLLKCSYKGFFGFGLPCFIFASLYMFIPNSTYLIRTKELLNITQSYLSGGDVFFFAVDAVCIPLIWLFTAFSLVLAFKLKTSREAPKDISAISR